MSTEVYSHTQQMKVTISEYKLSSYLIVDFIVQWM